MTQEILYFDKPGPANTPAVAEVVARRRSELGIEHIVVASNTGATALTVWEAVADSSVTVVSVGEHFGFRGGDEQDLSDEQRQVLGEKGIKVFLGSHALSGVERSITNKLGGVSRVELIAHVLRRFGCEGLKVAVECAVMAADAGLVPTDREILSVGGSGKGADCAVVMVAAHQNNFFDMEVREILCKARSRGK